MVTHSELLSRIERQELCIDRARMERAQAEDAETAATERAELAEAQVAELVEFVRTCAGAGYLNTRGTARQLLQRLGISSHGKAGDAQ